jgi:hypothetical protein
MARFSSAPLHKVADVIPPLVPPHKFGLRELHDMYWCLASYRGALLTSEGRGTWKINIDDLCFPDPEKMFNRLNPRGLAQLAEPIAKKLDTRIIWNAPIWQGKTPTKNSPDRYYGLAYSDLRMYKIAPIQPDVIKLKKHRSFLPQKYVANVCMHEQAHVYLGHNRGKNEEDEFIAEMTAFLWGYMNGYSTFVKSARHIVPGYLKTTSDDLRRNADRLENTVMKTVSVLIKAQEG